MTTLQGGKLRAPFVLPAFILISLIVVITQFEACLCGAKSVVMEDTYSTYKSGTKTIPSVQQGVVTTVYNQKLDNFAAA